MPIDDSENVQDPVKAQKGVDTEHVGSIQVEEQDLAESEASIDETAKTDGSESEGEADPTELEEAGITESEASLTETAAGVVAGAATNGDVEETTEHDVNADDADEEIVAEDDPDQDKVEGETVAEDDAGVDQEGDAAEEDEEDEEEEEEKGRRRLLLLLLLLLLMLMCCVGAMFYRYVNQPEPLPDLLPVDLDLDYPPHYLFSIYGMDQPVGVALSPQGDQIYVAETGGDRLIRVFDRDGNPVGSFAPPHTRSPERSPVYVVTDSTGRVFVTDRLQHAVFVYDREGAYLDTILSPDLTLSEYVFKHVKDLNPDATFAYNVFEAEVYFQRAGKEEETLPVPDPYAWSPLGIRIDGQGNVLLTDVGSTYNAVHEIEAVAVPGKSWRDFDPPHRLFGETGQGSGQLLFPNSAVKDSQDRIYVTDGNNGRVSAWDGLGGFLFNFGQGSGDGALSLPRGAAMDERDRLYVVDAVGQNVKVYDVSGAEPAFLFVFGDWGPGDGQFNYPNDIALDATGRLYIADRENNRIQVWSY